MEKKLKNIWMTYENKKLVITGNNNLVKGSISLSYGQLYTVFCFITRIFRRNGRKGV